MVEKVEVGNEIEKMIQVGIAFCQSRMKPKESSNRIARHKKVKLPILLTNPPTFVTLCKH